ncbi:hypothetical protein JW905_03445 [bacterium]|nr:hypothetical protein [candidate division CSSED10-310 bacterium]
MSNWRIIGAMVTAVGMMTAVAGTGAGYGQDDTGSTWQTVPGGSFYDQTIPPKWNDPIDQPLPSTTSTTSEQPALTPELAGATGAALEKVVEANQDVQQAMAAWLIAYCTRQKAILEAPTGQPELHEKELHLSKRLLDYQIWTVEERQRVFDWHRSVSTAIFYVTHLLLLIGITTALSELNKAKKLAYGSQKQSENLARKSDDKEDEAKITEVTLGLQGISVKSSRNGMILFLISLGFYFLYLKFVYPLTQLSGGLGQ